MPVVGKLKCVKCDGTGSRWRKGAAGYPEAYKCPACNGTGINQEDVITKDLSAHGANDLIKSLAIPVRYNDDFSGDTLTRLAPIAIPDRDTSFDNLIRFMEGYIAHARVGEIAKKSFFLTAPHGFGKNYFIYTVMRNLAKAGKRPSKFWALSDVDIIKSTFEQLTNVKKAEGMDESEFEDYISIREDVRKSDVIFMKINPGIKSYTAWENLSWMLDFCARNGKPLVVVANRPVSYYKFFDIYVHDATERNDYGDLQKVTISQAMNLTYLNYYQANKTLKQESVASQKKKFSQSKSADTVDTDNNHE